MFHSKCLHRNLLFCHFFQPNNHYQLWKQSVRAVIRRIANRSEGLEKRENNSRSICQPTQSLIARFVGCRTKIGWDPFWIYHGQKLFAEPWVNANIYHFLLSARKKPAASFVPQWLESAAFMAGIPCWLGNNAVRIRYWILNEDPGPYSVRQWYVYKSARGVDTQKNQGLCFLLKNRCLGKVLIIFLINHCLLNSAIKTKCLHNDRWQIL